MQHQYDGNGNVTQITPPLTDPVTPLRTFTYAATFSQVNSRKDFDGRHR